jgi:hypothetical protein
MLPFMEQALESEYEAVQNRAGVFASLAQMYKQIYLDPSRMKVASAFALKARRHEQPGVRVFRICSNFSTRFLCWLAKWSVISLIFHFLRRC